jgi:hypothetical protein
MSSWRKISLGSWRPTGDSSVYASLDVPAESCLEYVSALNASASTKITLTHVVGAVIAQMFARHPQLNSVIRFGRIHRRLNVDVFFHIAPDKTGEDLSGSVIRFADQKSVVEIASELNARADKERQKASSDFNKVKSLYRLVPGLLSKWILDLTSFIQYTLNLWSPLLGPPQDAFGSVMVTSLGPLNLKNAFVPIAPYTRIPIVFSIGKVHQAPVVRNQQIQIGKQFTLCITFDHRLVDGVTGAAMVHTLEEFFANPAKYLPSIPQHYAGKLDGSQRARSASTDPKTRSTDRNYSSTSNDESGGELHY